ncbi:hypothetical protein O181_116295 [Austropuccinia psidii MF-1]|uniref:Uncharacterized protein n=1 Tax=Austropuccinia psidii MF-1 TaxID=1389203 RepID=A0A9Q3KC40_9BASI|nr:hypothetical protein [Austropuccinia psidii MF-1]
MAHLPLTLFEDGKFQAVLEILAPQFEWPRCKTFARMAENLYYTCKASILKLFLWLPKMTPVTHAIDMWTTKDQRHSYMTIVFHWIDKAQFQSKTRLVAFELIDGVHLGKALTSCFWDAMEERALLHHVSTMKGKNASNNHAMITQLQHKYQDIGMTWTYHEHFHFCAFHVLCRLVKDFLNSMSQLTNEDYIF